MGEGQLSARDRIVQYLRDELIGPRHGEIEIVGEAPFRRYTAGTLYPQNSDSGFILAEDEEEVSGQPGVSRDGGLLEDQGDDPVTLANQYMPSSCGISFYLSGSPDLDIDIHAAWYEHHVEAEEEEADKVENETDALEEVEHPDSTFPKSGRKSKYKRNPLSSEVKSLSPRSMAHQKHEIRKKILNERAFLSVVWRTVDIGWLVTVTVINSERKDGGRFKPENCLHQVEILCKPGKGGKIPAYFRDSILTNDPEDEILEMLYRDRLTYGVGHGCSVDWTETEKGSAVEIRNEFLPAYEVPPITYDLNVDFDEVLSICFLAGGDKYAPEMIQKLRSFLGAYRSWVQAQPDANSDITARLHGVRDVLLERMENAAGRMEKGIDLLERDREVREAFCLANKAMLLQHIHSLEDYSGKIKPVDTNPYVQPDMADYQDRKWRPFQLAFQLLAISSVAFPEDPDRDLVDLIWFPTGGGKTEAYLAIVAFQIFYRRMLHGTSGYGTTAIMRYTLRLLTTQQFQRAATLLCACEMLRREDPRLGEEEISIGLWVGGSSTPNSFEKALEEYEQLLVENEPKSPYQIDRCPWCGTAMVPEVRSENQELYGFHSSKDSFMLFCPEATCPFHKKLPVEVVDEQLYDAPPTLLIATVDKFARMTWVEEAGVFFGSKHRRPPELIIQDELHLISGPLGTIVGLYETTIEGLACHQGVRPKILASTATIRRADEQIKGLYARSVELFPPSGLCCDDSYFARYDSDARGRLYVGFMGQGHTGSTSMIRASAALLQSIIELELDENEIDPYWTLVAYHNSLRELGKTLTFARDDVPARIKVIATDQSKVRGIGGNRVEELTSNVGRNLTEMLDRLERRYDEDGGISFLACSNMLSVGVDIQRLGLMLVNGQPKSTSEYIQSTSRVGRGVDGLIFCLLSPTKPRDRSHFERFISYHSALYRFVEPSSVTPFSAPARDRALHAVLVSLVRHLLGLSGDTEAGNFSQDLPGLQEILQHILLRVEKVDPGEVNAAEKQLRLYLSEWETRAATESNLKYRSGAPQIPAILRTAGNQRSSGWDTLHSMRNVDRSCLIRIVKN